MKKTYTAALITLTTAASSLSVNAALVLNLHESGGNINLTYSGSIDLSATQGIFNSDSPNNWIYPNSGSITVPGNTAGVITNYSVDFANYVPFGTSGISAGVWTSSIGDPIAMFTNPVIGLPQGYAGGPLSGSAVIIGQTFASLGITPGTYVNTFTNGLNSDSLTIAAGAPSPIPEPSTYIATSGISLLIGFVVWRRKKLRSKSTAPQE